MPKLLFTIPALVDVDPDLEDAMALAIAFNDVKKNQVRNEASLSRGQTGGSLSTKFFISRTIPDFPHAGISEYDAGRKSSAHFHVNDQFQVVVRGKGKLGGHRLAPYSVHFSRAYTPYGPLSADDAGLAFIAMRSHYDPGAQRLPAELNQLKQVPDRRPWQITSQVSFPAFPSGSSASDSLLQAIPGIRDDQGLAAYTLSMKPNAKTYAPDPSHGDGQYLVVVKGSVWHENREHAALALVFVYPKEGGFQIDAGPQGLEALVLNFPQRKPRPMSSKAESVVAGFRKWQCALCEFAYDEAVGMPEEGIPAGTRWQDVPETWGCPDCGASKSDFQMVELKT